MTDTTGFQPEDRIRLDWIVIGVVVVLCAGIFLYLLAGRQYALRDSASGFDGLEYWLNNQSHTAQSFTGGWPLDRSSVGLLIQPIYDTNPGSDRDVAQTKEDLLLQTDEFDQDVAVIREKAQSVPSLIILPKWRSGMRLTGFGHPFLIAPRADVQALLHQLAGMDVGQVFHAHTPFSEYALTSDPDESLLARIYAAQVFEGRGCVPILGRPGAMVLGLCPLPSEGEQDQVYVLSDPDLLNNHGLSLGDNAWIAAQLLPDIAGEGRIVIDYSDQNWLTESEQVIERERTWEDLKRLFQPPFLILWIGSGILLILAIWRGGIRNGPVHDPQPMLGTGKRTANRVRARLMRLTDQDGALLTDFIDTRLRAHATATFGTAHKIAGRPEVAYLNFVRARHPDLAQQLEELIDTIRALPAHLSAADAIPYVDQFELILEQLADDA
ncbi:hypothetical protein HW561_18655 [Rhodobacteraceae bacterium B1Z28]|uniref:DUF4350 domain-containing protein n=1 Tax=Ruegeria haliotis TaxID=2747601 RepID=A0ABX2PUG2_9RHOB|nr:hypothetical protein [Ruegeria haliotis]NVO57822.1 hypothetical protein [Ruegeria haliotis]